MKYTVHLRPDAEADIEESAMWYENQAQGLGDSFLDEVLNTLEVISENSYIYAVVHRQTRRALIDRFPFAIYYRIEEDSLIIIAVMHGSRHPKRWQNRR